jgi:tetratricopeptide (TPR) repeat protein
LVAGFCANDIEDYAGAERWLEAAMALSPTTPQAPNELTHALVFQRKFDRADAVIDTVLANTDDRCELARAWRRRGYIRFEQRRLDDSRIAYQKSLEYDPGSEIARSELALLHGEIEREGGHPDWYVPPASGTKVTVCAPG